jgi:Protein of unknown function (DUF3641)
LCLLHAQATLEPLYKQELHDAFDITFGSLLCLNNMPIKRYWEYLERRGELEQYMQLLVQSFNGAAGEALMCRETVSIAWDGRMCALPLVVVIRCRVLTAPCDVQFSVVAHIPTLHLRPLCEQACIGAT